jgi:ubiquinone/menaquinone biosynthesis C-methylase UbiE
MQFTSLASSGLGLSPEEITTLFEPFIARRVAAGDPQWQAEMRERKRGILRRYLKRVLLPWSSRTRRDEREVIREYSRAWKPGEYENYRLGGELPRLSPWIYRGERMYASDIGGTRFRQAMLVRMIEHVKPRSVLEVGCGNGINLLLLAGRFPDVEFAGIELTREGNAAALEFQRHEVLPEAMQAYAPLPLKDPTAFRRIRFLRGNAAELPFADNEFDLVYSVLALEQMEQIRDRALAEFARVAGKHALMIEPFRDVNNTGWPRANVIRRNYFRGRIADLPAYGLKPVIITDDFPQEVFLRACAVLSEKVGRGN